MVSGVEELVAKAERHCTAMQVCLTCSEQLQICLPCKSHVLEIHTLCTTLQAEGVNEFDALWLSQLICKSCEAQS